MTKTKRITSVLLTLCLAVVMLVGVLIIAPVRVKAAMLDFSNLGVGDIVNAGDVIDLTVAGGQNVLIEYSDVNGNPQTTDTAIGTYTVISSNGYSSWIVAGKIIGGGFLLTLQGFTPMPTPSTPTPAAPQEDTFWHDVLSGLAATDANGTFTVDATHHSFVPHFISQHLDLNSGKTIIVKTNLGNFRLTRARLLAAGLDVDYSYTYEELAAAGLLSGGAPQTGDTSNLPLWTLCGILALAGLALCTVLSRRKVTQR